MALRPGTDPRFYVTGAPGAACVGLWSRSGEVDVIAAEQYSERHGLVSAMGWTLLMEEECIYLATDECRKMRNEKSIQYGPLSAVGGGRTCGELWFKFKNDRRGKRMLRNLFAATSTFAKEKKLDSSKSNTDFINILTENGLEKIIKNSSTNKGGQTSWPEADGCIAPQYAQADIEMQCLKAKSAGLFTVPVSRVLPALQAFSVRDINSDWVLEIRDMLQKNPSTPVTRIPVLIDRHEVETSDTFREEMLTSTCNIYALGGNHLIQAMKMVIEQNPGNDNFKCLRNVDVEVYCGLSNIEARYVGSLHNIRCNTLKTTFQDKVRNSRAVFQGYGTSTEISWKDASARSLGLLCGKDIKRDGIPVILSVASYCETNYGYVTDIFQLYEKKSPMGSSFPQVLFKNLLPVKDEHRTPFLAAAVGTNGVKQARLVMLANKERLLQQVMAKSMKMTVDEALISHADEMEAVKKFADTEITKSKVPRCVMDFIEKVKNNEDIEEEDRDVQIQISIKINGKEVKGHKIELMKKASIKKFHKQLKSFPTDLEE